MVRFIACLGYVPLMYWLWLFPALMNGILARGINLIWGMGGFGKRWFRNFRCMGKPSRFVPPTSPHKLSRICRSFLLLFRVPNPSRFRVFKSFILEKFNEVNQMGGGEKWRSLTSFITVANIVYGRLTGKEVQIFSIVKELEQEIRLLKDTGAELKVDSNAIMKKLEDWEMERSEREANP